MINITKFIFNSFQENTWLVSDETNECIIIDPGCINDQERTILKEFIVKQGLKPVKSILTHGHVDHVCGTGFIKEIYDLSPECHKLDVSLMKEAPLHGKIFGVEVEPSPTPVPSLIEGQKVVFGESAFEIIHVPGHSAGSVAFFNQDESLLFTGDVLFKGSIGRTDLPGGDYNTLMKRIHEKIVPLGLDVRVFSGHGGETTIGDELNTNPFINLEMI